MTSIIIAIGALTFLFAYLFISMGRDSKEHFIFQVLLFFFILAGVFLMGKAAYDNPDSCEWLLNSTVTSGNTTTYFNEYHCAESPQGTSTTTLKLTTWFFRVSVIYIFIYFVYKVLEWMGIIVRESDR